MKLWMNEKTTFNKCTTIWLTFQRKRFEFEFKNQFLHISNRLLLFRFKLIATSQKFEKYQEFDLKKSNQILKVKLKICLDVKLKFLILTSSSNSNRNFRLEIWLDIKSNFWLELEVWFEKLDLIWNIIYKKYQKWLFSL